MYFRRERLSILLVKRAINTVHLFICLFIYFKILTKVERYEFAKWNTQELLYIDSESLIQKREETSSVKNI